MRTIKLKIPTGLYRVDFDVFGHAFYFVKGKCAWLWRGKWCILGWDPTTAEEGCEWVECRRQASPLEFVLLTGKAFIKPNEASR